MMVVAASDRPITMTMMTIVQWTAIAVIHSDVRNASGGFYHNTFDHHDDNDHLM